MSKAYPDHSWEQLPVLVRFGTWVGGDMDGNPNVDADTLRATLARHRQLALGLYVEEVASLARNLTQSASRGEPLPTPIYASIK